MNRVPTDTNRYQMIDISAETSIKEIIFEKFKHTEKKANFELAFATNRKTNTTQSFKTCIKTVVVTNMKLF